MVLPSAQDSEDTLRAIPEQQTMMEDELRRARAELEERVAARTAELTEANRRLQAANHELQQFAYIASHDLQEPLRGITGFLELLQLHHQGKPDATADRFIGHAMDGASRMQELINALLAYSRITTEERAFARVDGNAALADALANLRVAIEESKATVTHDPLPTVMGDAVQLAQVFQNLIGNAVKFRGPAAPVAHVGVAQEGDTWVFSVRDNGIGIPDKDRERIFLIFQRLHTRSEYPGAGIGLAICKKIVERHGGKIWAESAPGSGAAFYFTLPLCGE